MKLAVVTNILPPYRIPLFAAIAERVEDFAVFLMAETEENRQWNVTPVPFHTVMLPGWHVRLSKAESSIHVNHGVIRRLCGFNPDVVMSGGFATAQVASYAYCKVFNKRYVQWGEFTMYDGAARSKIRRLIRRLLIGGADGCVASSADARDAFLHYGAYGRPIMTVPMPLDVRTLREETERHRGRFNDKRMAAPYCKPVLLSIGQLIARKGYRELFRIYGKLIENCPEATLIIIGDGPERLAYQDEVRRHGWRHVHFVGHVQPSELPRYFAVADVFVFHTLYDAYGLVLSEAMAAGVPVVSSVYASATRELVEDGVTGFSIDPKDAAASAGRILAWVRMSEENRRAIVEAAYQRVLQCDSAIAADHMVMFLRSVLDPSQDPRGLKPTAAESLH